MLELKDEDTELKVHSLPELIGCLPASIPILPPSFQIVPLRVLHDSSYSCVGALACASNGARHVDMIQF